MYRSVLSVALLSATALFASSASAAVCKPYASLTGTYRANDGGTYRIRAMGNQVWWVGESADGGASWTNVFKGTRNGNIVNGQWADVGNDSSGSGAMALRVTKNFQLVKINGGGNFGGTRWLRPGCNSDNSVPID